MSTCELSPIRPSLEFQENRASIQLNMCAQVYSTAVIVERLTSIQGPIDVISWYIGPKGLPQSGAQFMKAEIFAPLYALKPDARLCLYSLSAWNFPKTVTQMPSTTSLGQAINGIHTTALECIESAAFFQYCVQAATQKQDLCAYIGQALPTDRLLELSSTQRKTNKTVGAFFENQPSLLNCVQCKDLSEAYSTMQYVEAYYLIQKSIEYRLTQGQKKITIAFVLPNDESKYYLELNQHLSTMLSLDFKERLSGIAVNIAFYFFKYGETPNARPYIDKKSKATKIKPKQIAAYFDYLPARIPLPPQPSCSLKPSRISCISKQSRSQEPSRIACIPRDMIHNLNGWYTT